MVFKPGKLTFVLDGGAGSSAKGMRGAYLWKYLRPHFVTFAVNTFMENAAHTITHRDGREYIHQCLSSITSLGGYQKQYVSPGSVFAAKTMIDEIKAHNITPHKLGIHPNAVIVTPKDIDYEKGLVDFEGNSKQNQDSINLRIGSTLHGVGAARARRILRRDDVVLAKDIPELAPYICDTNIEIMDRLDRGEAGIMEIAQGYQLSLMSRFFPKTTSRNCSVSAALDDSLLPPSVCGPVVVNFRTYPIRVNNNKYIRNSDKKILTWEEFVATPEHDKTIIKGDSGGCYPDQEELTWEQISSRAGSKIFECTSLTKLPRRVYTFSKLNLLEALRYNSTGDDTYVSVNFMNYVDASVQGKSELHEVMTNKVSNWLRQNILDVVGKSVRGVFIGTWKTIDDSAWLKI
jgi:adenylosuccinate synthase